MASGDTPHSTAISSFEQVIIRLDRLEQEAERRLSGQTAIRNWLMGLVFAFVMQAAAALWFVASDHYKLQDISTQMTASVPKLEAIYIDFQVRRSIMEQRNFQQPSAKTNP